MLEPLTQTSAVIQLHTYSAIAATLLGGFVLFWRKGTKAHKLGGRLWVAMMVTVAVSSFFISGIRHVGPFSAIHLLSVFTLITLAIAIRHARNGRIAAHRGSMQSLYFGALIVAGAFTFLPGRIMNETFVAPVLASLTP